MEVAAIWNIVIHEWLEQIDSRIYQKVKFGFLYHRPDDRAITINYSIGHLQVILPHGHGQSGPVLLMIGKHGAEVYAGKNVAVNHQQRLLWLLHQTQGSG